MDPVHRISDRQSLRLNQAAIDALKQQPERLQDVLATLDHRDAVAPMASKPLRDQWREIVLGGLWERALALDDSGQQLRQSSPLGRALPARRRLEIIRACKGRNSNT
ncbi:MAG: hypothetical protein IH627_15915 [Rubrivivax sp.]|nr:hypothetical protein [Rubrivivax sp.]